MQKSSTITAKPVHSPLDREIERIDKGETTWSDADDVVEVEFKKTLDKVIPVRLSDDHWRLLREEAQGLGVGPSTLLRMWVLEKLRERRRASVA
jgi:hypothetical protein